MKPGQKIKAALAAAAICLPLLSQAQFMETFESVTGSGTVKPATFNSNGQAFSLITGNCSTGGTFGVFVPSQVVAPCNGGSNGTNNSNNDYGVGTSCASGVCSGFSAKFIDNSGGPSNGTSQLYAIKTSNAALFTIKSLYLFLSADHAVTPSAAGGVTFRGKVAGSTVFTFVKTTGFNTSYSTNQGFTFVDFGANGTINIDELEIQGGASTNYLAIDNFTWGAAIPLPVTLTGFAAVENNGQVRLDWSVALETAFSHYEVEKSRDGKEFIRIASVAAGSDRYTYFDKAPYLGANYYRLRMADRDGRSGFSTVVSVISNSAATVARVYPNPVRSTLFVSMLQPVAADVQVFQVTGSLAKKISLKAGDTQAHVEDLPQGIYQYRITGRDGAILGQGSFSKE